MKDNNDMPLLRLVSKGNDIGAIFKDKLKSIQEKKSAKVEPVNEEYRKGGEAIRIIRERLDLSRAEFASLLNLSQNIIGKWERAINRPSINTLLGMKFTLEKGGYPAYANMLRPEDFGYEADKI